MNWISLAVAIFALAFSVWCAKESHKNMLRAEAALARAKAARNGGTHG
jgi:hypothetical protein